MLLFLLAVFLYAFFLILYIPSPDSLKAKAISRTQNFCSIRASFFTGILIIVVFFITSDFNFLVIDEKAFEKLALHCPPASMLSLLFQLISHAFVHLDITHLLGNLTAIGIFSVYERRVGPRRFLAILAVGCISAILSVFFHAQPYSVCGISGGVYGLAAAYFLDHEDLTLKDWIYSLIALACLMAVFSVIDELESKKLCHTILITLAMFLGQ